MLRRLIITLLFVLSISAASQAADLDKDMRKAAEKCDLPKVHRLLSKGAEVNDKDDKGVAALMLAAGKGCAEVVQALLDAGADVEAKDNNGLTAAMLAERNGYADVVKLLNRPRSSTTEETASAIPCASIKMKSGEKSKQERFFPASEKRVKEVVVDAMLAIGFVVKKDKGHKLEAIRKYPELGGGGAGGEKLKVSLETVEQSGSSVTRVTTETRKGFVGRLRQHSWSDAVLDQAECLFSLFDLRTDEEIQAENTAPSDGTEEQARQKIILPDGVPIKLRLRRYLSANDAEEGKRVAFQVADDVVVDGTVVIEKGAIAWGQITMAEQSKSFNRAARLNFSIDSVSAVNGQNISVRSHRKGLGGTSGAKTAATVTATSALRGGIGILGLALTKGKNIGVRAGTEFIVFSNGNLSLKLKLNLTTVTIELREG